MKITVNLATRPFIELRPFLLRLRWLMGAFAVVSVALIVTTHLLQKKLDIAQAQMDAVEKRTSAAAAEKTANERRMKQPANAAVLERAHFLNLLFLRKSFSWTAVLMDLETVLPTGVQITAIEPQVSADGEVVIRLRVAGDRDRAVQLVRNLEHSKRFLQPRLSSEALQAKEGGVNAAAAIANGAPAGVEFEILANYNPLPEGESYAKAKPVVDKADKPAGSKPATAPAHRNPGVILKPMPAMKPQQPAAKPNPQTPPAPAQVGGGRQA
jgi:type IV pilus assembly protein PilN